jgi:hypothetical protein
MRASHHAFVKRWIAPAASQRPINASHSAKDSRAGGAPLRGSVARTSARVESRPVSVPRKKGEFAETASTTGSHGSSASSARSAVSPSGMPMCTCSPHTAWRRATGPAKRAKSR